ncbi:MAG: hypothetical protein K0S56_4525 [Microvirga sp.]|jgi:hypothetical protein|nr:hypothetical protein [Microvirga sp.]
MAPLSEIDMTKPFLLAAAAVLTISASAPASAQYFPLGNVLNNLGNAATPSPEMRPAQGRASTAAPQKRGRPTHIIPPQSTRSAGARSYPRENSAPSEDND